MMNQTILKSTDKTIAVLFLTSVLLPFSVSAAAPIDLNINSQPLELTLGVEPNLMIVVDDSGSMEDEFMTPEVDGDYFIGGTQYWKMYYLCTNYPTEAAVPWSSTEPGIWRIRNADYNKMYYNPLITYESWAGKVAMAISSSGATSFSVPQNPSKSSCGTVDILANSSNDLQYYPRYYKWDDANTDGVVDAGEQGTHVLIKSSTATYTIGSSSKRTDCGSDNASCSYEQEINNFANWFTYHRRREFSAKYALGHVAADTEAVRMGYATINNNNSDKLRIAEMTGNVTTGTKGALIDKIYGLDPRIGTPLRDSLNKAGKYIECKGGSFFTSSDSSLGDSDCPVLASNRGGQCQQNFTILMTDGYYNGSSVITSDQDSDGNTAFDKGAYSDNADGSGRSKTLADIAMYYYERDLHSSLSNKVPLLSVDTNGVVDASQLDASLLVNSTLTYMHQHMKTFTVGFGVNGTLNAMPTDVTDATFIWPSSGDNSGKIDDLRHSAYNGRGDFYSASDPNALTTALSDIFEEISSGSGTASAVSFNTQEINAETKVYRAFFNTKSNTGDLVAQDVDQNTGVISSSYAWQASVQLDLKAADGSDRALLSYDTSTGNGIAFRHGNLSATLQAALTTDQVNYLRGDRTNEEGGSGTDAYRARLQTKGRLGDIIHSTPLYIGPPAFSRRDFTPYPTAIGELYSEFASTNSSRTPLVYVSANDGIMHAFNASTGNEAFGYVPSNIIDDMEDLTDPNYNHQYYVDLTPVANDVYIRPTGTGSTYDWKTVLVGGQGAGGKSYFALDITGANLTEASSGTSKVLWEFSHPELGLTYSPPSIVMTNVADNGQQRWAAVFGNGYNSTSGIAKLFIVFLDGGIDGTWTLSDDYVVIDTAAGPTTSLPMNGLGIPRLVDKDGNGTADYAYAGDLHGNMYRFDLTNTSAVANSGSNNWDATTIFTAKYLSASTSPQPITTKPLVTLNPTFTDDLIVNFATGSWFTTSDTTSTDIQSIYGIWDDLSRNDLVSKSDLVEQTVTNVVDATYGDVRTLTDNSVTYANGASTDEGWFIDLDAPTAGSATGVEFPGERAVRNLQTRGDYLFINTIIPQDSSSCVPGSGGFELAFSPTTGGAGTEPIFDFNGDNSFTVSDNVTVGGNSHVVAGRRFDGAVPSDATFIGNKRYTQLSDQTVVFIGTNTGGGLNTGRVSWKEL
jgi:type IV pilus assembly protein PilY1